MRWATIAHNKEEYANLLYASPAHHHHSPATTAPSALPQFKFPHPWWSNLVDRAFWFLFINHFSLLVTSHHYGSPRHRQAGHWPVKIMQIRPQEKRGLTNILCKKKNERAFWGRQIKRPLKKWGQIRKKKNERATPSISGLIFQAPSI